MAKTLEGHCLFAEFVELRRFNYTDPTTGAIKPIESLRLLMEFGDRRRDYVDVGFPRDDQFRAPSLEKGKVYGFPVTAYINRKNRLSYTLRTDLPPFDAPSFN